MERARRGQARRALPRLGPRRLGALDGRRRAGDDDLPRAVEVRGREHVALRAAFAQRDDAFLVSLEQRGHRARIRARRFVHNARTRLDETKRLLVTQHAGKCKRADLAEREAEQDVGLDAARHEGAADADGERGDGDLRVARLVELRLRLVALAVDERGDVAAEHVGRAFERGLHLGHAEKRYAHAGLLRTLTRGHEHGLDRADSFKLSHSFSLPMRRHLPGSDPGER